MKPAEYNKEELSHQAPILYSIEKKEVFKVPDGYFDAMAEQIMDQVAMASSLEEVVVANPFAVPDDYFETLPLNIIKRVEAARSKRFSPGELFARAVQPKYSLSLIAACFALFICVHFFEKPVLINASQSHIYTADNVSINEADVLGEVDENTLMSVVADESSPMIKSANYISTADKNMEDYIINNNIDISDIVKEL